MTDLRRPLRLAVATAVLAVAAVGLPSLPASAAPPPKHVAVIVAGVATACVPWHSGMNGGDVLTAGGFHPQYGQRSPYLGFVMQLSGQPATPDPAQRYWAYFQMSGGRWQYSGSGALSSKPLPGGVEGWALSSTSAGSSGATEPPLASYASICGGIDPTPAPPVSAPRTTPPPVRSTAPAAGPTANAGTTSGRAPGATSTAAPTRTSPGSTASSGPGSSTGAIASSTPPPTAPPPTTAGPAEQTTAAGAILPTAPPKANRPSSSGVPPWGTALAIALVAALGGGAFWRTRTQRQRRP